MEVVLFGCAVSAYGGNIEISVARFKSYCMPPDFVRVSSNTMVRFNSGTDKLRPLNPHSEMEAQRCRSDLWVRLSESVLFYDNGADMPTRTGL